LIKNDFMQIAALAHDLNGKGKPAAVDARWSFPRWISAATRLIGSLRILRYGAALRIEFPGDYTPLSSLQPR
jgi:hypothetical protein